MYRIRHFQSFNGLPPAHADLMAAEAARCGFFRSPAWFEHLMLHYYLLDQEFRLYAVEDGSGRPLLLVPLCFSTRDQAVPGARTIAAISHPENYTGTALIFAASVDDRHAVLTALLRHFRHGDHDGSQADVLRLWPVEMDSDLAGTLHRALRGAGFVIQTYANSYNRYEDTAGLGYDAYFAARSANLRYSVRRRQRALAKAGAVELVLCRDTTGLDEALADYVNVAMASWKQPVTMIADNTLQLIRLTARLGCMRLGVLRLDGLAVAAQFWIVSGGVANCSRLAYHEAYKKLAIGVVLTDFMIAHVLDQDHVTRIDFGYGHEDYKGGWMKDARDYYGFMAFNPATRRGLFHGARHILGRPVKRAIRRGLHLLGLRRQENSAAGEAE